MIVNNSFSLVAKSLLTGFIAAYPMNWWLVTNHLKHGMMTVRPNNENAEQKADKPMNMEKPGSNEIAIMTVLSFIILAAGIAIAFIFS